MEREQRKLTASEQKRKLQFDKLSARLVADGYKRYDLTVDIVKVSFIALAVMLPFVGVAVVLYFAVNGAQGLNGSFKELLLFVAVTVACVFVHEGIHGLVWAICCRSFKAISFGIIVRTLTPYCTCARPLKKWQYIAGAAMPTLLLGVGLTALAVITSRLWLLITAVTLIFGRRRRLLRCFSGCLRLKARKKRCIAITLMSAERWFSKKSASSKSRFCDAVTIGLFKG